MWSSGRRVLQDLLSQPAVRSVSVTPALNTVVVERWWQVPLSKIGSPPRLYPRRHRIYKLVENTKDAPKKKMELILTQNIPKLGGRGDTVFVKKSVGRNKLLAQGLAVYPSPDNKLMFADELKLLREGRPEDRIQTRTGQLLGVVVPPHALRLPFEPITDLGDYWCEVTVNGIDSVRIPMSLVPYEDPSASYQRMLKTQRQQQAAADVSEPADEGETVVKAVSEVAVETEPGIDSVSQVSEASASAGASDAEQTSAASQASQDTTAPPSDSPKKE
ncbi:hypothetical protein PAMP_008165 [Pampus punctatissimus]